MPQFAAALCLGFLLAVLTGGRSHAEDFASLDLLWVDPAAPAGAARPCSRLLTSEAPRDWMTGDAAVLIILPASGREWEAALTRLRRVLLRENAAVLEYRGGPAEGCTRPPPTALGEVLGALHALADQGGAGLVVAIGLDAAYGDAVLAATAEDVAAGLLGPHGPRLAAAIAIDAPGRARFAAGAPLAADQDWPERGRFLCRAVGEAAGLGDPRPCFLGLGAGDPPLVVSRRRP